MSGPDPLFDVKNAFYLGNWQQCLNEVQKAKTKTDEQKLEQDVFMYRAYTAQKKFGFVSSEIRDSMPAPLQAVKLLAKYHSLTSSSAKAEIAEQIDADFDRYTSDSVSQLIAATIQYYEKNYDLALKVLYKSDDLECMALAVQTFLQLDRLDLARKEYKRMAEKDEYCTLSQLALMSIYLFQAGEKLQDAFFILQELREKFGSSSLLLNGQAASLIAQGKLQEAESLVQETIDRDPNYTEAIINQMILAQYNNKSEIANRLFNQLKDSPGAAGDIFLADYEVKEREFDKICLQYCS